MFIAQRQGREYIEQMGVAVPVNFTHLIFVDHKRSFSFQFFQPF